MNLESLRQIVSEIDAVSEHVDYILSLTRPCANITLADDAGTDACSRFGGHPFLPADFNWPSYDVGEYRFLGQIDFSEIDDRPESLPDSGVLSLFYAFDEDGEVFWGDDGYVLGFYWPTCDGHSLFASPTADVPEPRRINLVGGIEIPRHEDLRSDWPFDRDAIYELTDALDDNSEYLLGYPSFTSLAYDPTPEGDWISLLTIHSLDEFDWCWHDGDKLMVFIESAKLADCDFGNLKSDAG